MYIASHCSPTPLYYMPLADSSHFSFAGVVDCIHDVPPHNNENFRYESTLETLVGR